MTTKKKQPLLRWGLLSTAHINRALIPPIRKSKRSLIAAVASRNLETAQKFAHDWDIPRAIGSYEALLADPQIDVIYNPLPNSLHAEWTIKALQAGKHVLCEKPLALSTAEVDAIATTADQTGYIVTEAFMYRHHTQTLKVKEIVDSGAIGKLKLVRGAYTYKGNRSNDPRLILEMGDGSIWDVGCYPINFTRYMIGAEPVEVFGWQINSQTGVDLDFVGQMKFAGDIYAQFYSSFTTPFRAFMEFIGDEGTLSIPTPFKPGLKEQIYLVHDKTIDTVKIHGHELYRGEVEDIEDAILLGKKPRINLQDSWGNIAAISALLQSAHSGKHVVLPTSRI